MVAEVKYSSYAWSAIGLSTVGAPLASLTVTWNSSLVLNTGVPSSVAVTVMLAVPSPASVMVRVVPVTLAVTTASSSLVAVSVSTSPGSGSLNTPVRSMVAVPKYSSYAWSAIGLSTVGVPLASLTVTWNSSLVLNTGLPSSVAVTVILAVPSPTSVMVRVVPVTPTVTTASSSLVAVSVSTSPGSGSLNTPVRSTVAVPKYSS